MWMLGGFQFSWATLYGLNEWAGYASLLNPLMYASEGYRSVILDPAQSLPFVACIGMLVFFHFLFTYMAIKRLKKQLDFV